MATVLHWRDFGGGRPFHAALVPLTDAPSPGATHSHADFHELVYVTAGSGRQHLTGGVTQALSTGTLALVRPHDVHDFSPDPGGCEVVNVAFASERWRGFLDYAQVGAAAAWETAPAPVLVHDAPGAVHAAMDRGLRDFQGTPRWVDLIRLWTAVVPSLEAALAAPDPRPAWLRDACAAMYEEANLARGLSRLRELAAVSDGHLARSMATFVGCTPVEFVNRVRLDHAATLLATTNLPAGSIADRCGFGSHAYFSGRFHARFGVAPGGYRSTARRAVVP